MTPPTVGPILPPDRRASQRSGLRDGDQGGRTVPDTHVAVHHPSTLTVEVAARELVHLGYRSRQQAIVRHQLGNDMPGKHRHRFHGDSSRFEVVAEFIYNRYGGDVQYIADVAGGQGMLCRILRKKYNYACEVVDPRGWTLKGVPGQVAEFGPSLADYYDLIVGLHPDEATRAVAAAALVRPTILIPCCNFWSEEKLGRDELIEAIEAYYRKHGVKFERVVFAFRGPKNIGLVSERPAV